MTEHRRDVVAKLPSIPFLRKVQAGDVRLTFRYSARKGGKHVFKGGEESYKAHLREGFVTPTGAADLGRPGVSTLTEKGQQALADADAKAAAKAVKQED
jgi:hypothetical protein